ncbi:Protein-export membrane protein [gamma proteobacterium HdN1]|nr:Protein-export membrane protein [gamma proteobacterium HdN1]
MRQFRARIWIYSIVILIGLLSAVPNFLTPELASKLPEGLAQNKIVLGLDLRGGSHLLLEVETPALSADRMYQNAEVISSELRKAGISHLRPAKTQDSAKITLKNASDFEKAAGIARSKAKQNGVIQFTVEQQGTSMALVPTPEMILGLKQDAAERSIDVLRRRLDETGVVDPTITRQGADSILVQLPGVSNPAHIRELLGKTARLTFHLVVEEGERSRGGAMTLPSQQGDSVRLEQRTLLDGAHLADARLGYNQNTGEPLVNFHLDAIGAKRFAKITKESIGRALAVVLDGRVITAPVIRGVIGGGSGEITGGFTVTEAKDLALLLRAGALPAPLKVIEERTVGPDLGSDAIQMGVTTGLLGMALVFIFIVTLYGRWGVIADVALALNIGLSVGVLSAFGATLTLPGIAGLILSIGMAVDANILINERIREEVNKTHNALDALAAGFDRAYATIIDSNLTTLIAISLLFLFGSGPIKGFAVAMAVGLVVSLFTAISVTRLLMEWRVRRGNHTSISMKGLLPLERIQPDKPIKFLNARVAGLTFSAVLSAASIALMFYPGLSKGIDFQGGNVIELRTNPQISVEKLRAAFQQAGLKEIAIQEFGAPGSFMVRSPLVSSEDAASGGVVDQIKEVVLKEDPHAEFPRVEIVGPKVSGSFADTSVLALLLAGGGMFVYLWIRFEFHFAIAALATLVLDMTKMLGFFALTGVEFNLSAVAALLALIGYSVNDKVVVFDRIREFLRKGQRNIDLKELMDLSITSTLTRTIFTSVTTFLCLLPMGIAGGAAVSSFALPMLFGIVLGTSSSIFIAAPILYLLGERRIRMGLGQIDMGETEEEEKRQSYP